MKQFHWLVWMVLAVFLCAKTARCQSTLYVLMVDISASRSAATLSSDQQFVRNVIEGLSAGDQLAVLQVLQSGVDTQAKRWVFTIPPASSSGYVTERDREKLKASVKSISNLVPAFFANNYQGAVLHTDILTTFAIVGQLLSDRGHRTANIVVLSDMLQSAKTIEMQGARRMPPADFIARQQRSGTLPNLHGACVFVVGADNTNAAGARIERFWQEYINAAGGTLPPQNYRVFPPASGLGTCQ